MTAGRQAFGIDALDRHLGGGLLPGTLTVIAGATGVGKTQLGLTWADHGLAEEGRRGILCDLTSRGDVQNHADYAKSLFDWTIRAASIDGPPELADLWDFDKDPGDYVHPFCAGRRVTRRDLEPDDWHSWKTDLARVLRSAATYFYSQFIRGTRRVVVDGIEPTERFSESIQFEFFEYLYHQVLRKEDSWAAREVLRERFRAESHHVEAHPYDHADIGCLYLYTTPHVLLDDLIAQPIGEGDIFTNANTIILMGRTKESGRMGRSLYVAKHRGSACGDEIVPYRITDRGLAIGEAEMSVAIDLSGKVALVTGASQGIGASIARALHRAGASVYLNHPDLGGGVTRRDSEALASAMNAERTDSAFVVAADVSDEAAVRGMMAEVRSRLGGLDLLVNNAGILRDRTIAKMSLEEWRAVIDTNLTGVFLGCKYGMEISRDGGAVVNMGSLSATAGFHGQSNYASAKAGVHGLTRVLAREGARRGIRVNAIAPGVIDTPLMAAVAPEVREGMVNSIPLRRFGHPDEVAGAVLFLVSPLASYITGHVLEVNGGWHG